MIGYYRMVRMLDASISFWARLCAPWLDISHSANVSLLCEALRKLDVGRLYPVGFGKYSTSKLPKSCLRQLGWIWGRGSIGHLRGTQWGLGKKSEPCQGFSPGDLEISAENEERTCVTISNSRVFRSRSRSTSYFFLAGQVLVILLSNQGQERWQGGLGNSQRPGSWKIREKGGQKAQRNVTHKGTSHLVMQEVCRCNSPGSLFEDEDWQETLKMGTTCRCIRTTSLYIEHSIEKRVYHPHYVCD